MTFGSTSSSPFVEDYAKATSPFGPISSNTFINSNFTPSNWRFGPTSSDEFLVGTEGGVKLRGQQFAQQTIALDRFTLPLAAVLTIFEDLDLTSTGVTTIYTVPSGITAFDQPTTSTVTILGCLVRVKSSTSATTDAIISLGVNPSTTNLFATETIVNVRSVGDFWSFWKDQSGGILATTGQNIDLDIVTAATATDLIADVYLIGLLI